MKKYYIPFDITKDINYLHLLNIYGQAVFNIDTGKYDTINYISIRELAERLKISPSTLNRILNNKDYTDILKLNQQDRQIIIQNDFKNGQKRPFVVLSDTEVRALKNIGDSFLIRYYLYIKFYCGYSKGKQDFTAEQFLTACGYSIKSNSNKDKLSRYNAILSRLGFINISAYRDFTGRKRNTYTVNQNLWED